MAIVFLWRKKNTLFQILMYHSTSGTVLQWVPAVSGHIPDQAVIFENRSQDDNIFVVKVIDGSAMEAGLYETNKTCAEYMEYVHLLEQTPRCSSTFEFLVAQHGERTTMPQVTKYCLTIACLGAYHQVASIRLLTYYIYVSVFVSVFVCIWRNIIWGYGCLSNSLIKTFFDLVNQLLPPIWPHNSTNMKSLRCFLTAEYNLYKW